MKVSSSSLSKPEHSSLTRYLFFILGALLLVSGVANAQSQQPRVVWVSPRGTVKNVRQVTAQFSEPMVPLGRAFGGAMPFDIECPEKGSARWIDTTRWAYDFAHDLPAGVRCTFRLRADLHTLAGNAFTSRPEFHFDTGGPAVLDSMPWQGSEDIDEQQAFVLALDAEPDAASVLANATFSVEGMPERIGVKILSGADREVLLKHFKYFIANRPVLILQAKQSFPNARGGQADLGQRHPDHLRGRDYAGSNARLQNPQAIRGVVQMRARERTCRMYSAHANVDLVQRTDRDRARKTDSSGRA